jgi:hypothetical protein
VDREAAAREAKRAVDARWTRTGFAQEAQLDPGTLSDFLEGRRWPQGPTRAKIEKRLGWPPGALDDLAAGQSLSGILSRATQARAARPVGLGLDDEAADLTDDDIEDIRALIRAKRARRGLE